METKTNSREALEEARAAYYVAWHDWCDKDAAFSKAAYDAASAFSAWNEAAGTTDFANLDLITYAEKDATEAIEIYDTARREVYVATDVLDAATAVYNDACSAFYADLPPHSCS